MCHRMQPRVQPADDHRPYLQYFLETSITGNFQLGKKGEIYGPFKDDEIAPVRHGTRDGPQAEARRLSEIVPTLRDVPYGLAAGGGSAAR